VKSRFAQAPPANTESGDLLFPLTPKSTMPFESDSTTLDGVDPTLTLVANSSDNAINASESSWTTIEYRSDSVLPVRINDTVSKIERGVAGWCANRASSEWR
jgi:hypothetical protein